ncbi:MAG: hypothetical protein KAT28_00595 [Candidatus Aenigmarchaeota archaeon]|nr:hypothetical protein [Candidatus Aenigmarchaeota archaeon]
MYSRKVEGDNVAKACSNNLRISVKNAKPVCKSVRGLGLPVAKQFLEDVLKAKRNIGGRYYPKTTREVLNIILSAEKNAEFKNLDTENMYILHIAPLEGTHMHRRRHKRNIGSRIKAAHLEVILKERVGKKAVESKTKTEAKKDEIKKDLKTQITKEIETKVRTQIAEEKKTEIKTPVEKKVEVKEKTETKTEEKTEVKKVETKTEESKDNQEVKKVKAETKKKIENKI